MNWNASNVKNGPKVAIAIVKLPAKVPVTDIRYGGMILLNPGQNQRIRDQIRKMGELISLIGGPGESGVRQILIGGKHVQTIVDSAVPLSTTPHSADTKYFDIIGFDPRGVNNTTPSIKCFPDAFAQQAWNLQVHAEGQLGSSDAAFNLMWARTVALGGSCAQDHGEESIVRNVNTAQVVRDMVEIIERHGEWREVAAERILGQAGLPRDENQKGIGLPESGEADIEKTRWRKNEEMLQYWGFSYGSILGSTFAAMYPERVGRMIIDGIVDPDDYYKADWLKNLQDTDRIVKMFCQYCAMAGPQKCPLYTGTGTSSVETEAYLNQILGGVKRNPIPVPASGTRGPEIIAYTDVKLMMVEALFSPYREIEPVFDILSLLAQRNGSRLADLKQQGLSPVCLNGQCRTDGPYSDSCWVLNKWVSGIAIFSSDGDDVTGATKEEYRTYVKQLERQSRWMGGHFAEIRMHCVNWPIRPEWSFKGNTALNYFARWQC
jgi:pimeloyl-ACP methyl ester carboxylesterase